MGSHDKDDGSEVRINLEKSLTQSPGLVRFITVIALADLLCATGCNVKVNVDRAGGRLAPAGAETWTIDDKAHRIASTYYLFVDGALQFTVDYQVADPTIFEGMDDARAGKVALPIMRHVVRNKLFQRAQISDATGKPQPVSTIGVALYSKAGDRVRGYRVARKLTQIPEGTGPGVAGAAGP